jgi:L-alanine-DL-glutamate epimerase-like enolase superfamily enzyme
VRIVKADIVSVAAPFPEPLRFGKIPMTTNTAVVAHLEEAGGAVGFGYAPTFGFGTAALRSHAADDFAPRLIRSEFQDTGAAIATMVQAAAISGRLAGSGRQAVALLEMALCDVEAQLAGVPLHRLWGQESEPVPIYASGGWRYLDIAELTAFARRRLLEGFDAVKMQIGLSPREDAARVQAVREAIGPDAELMVDANQQLPAELALEWVTALEPFAPTWVEEPLPAESHESLRSLRRESTLPMAAGESETEPGELADLLVREVVDVIQPDIHRVGLGAARAVRDQALGEAVTVSPHMAHEVSSHLLSGIPGNGRLEYFDWFEDWWETPVVPSAGLVASPRVPGHGLRLRPGWLEAHRADRVA